MRIFAPAPASAGLVALAFSLLPGADWAWAKPTDEQLAAIKANCRSDFMANCWGVPRGGAEAFQCLKDHLASLSAPCQQAVKAVMSTATPPSNAAAAAAAEPAGEMKPAASGASPPPPPAGAENAATSASADKASSAAVVAPQPNLGGTSATQSAPAPDAEAKSSATASASQPGTAKKKTSGTPSSAAAQGAAGAASEAAPVTSAATGSAAAPGVGFIAPRKKFMLARACRSDFNAHCPGVDLGQGRAVACLEANKASLTPDCREALAKIVP